jgi:glycosyltransferase involved in cell wall biosynthesis
MKPYWIFTGAMAGLRDYGYTYGEYGIHCRDGMIPEPKLPAAYASGALTIHMKTYDGYGYSMLQSIACGRPVVVPRGFHRYRTANKFLIPNLTCFETEWSDSDLMRTIMEATSDLETANKYAWACYTAAGMIFNWDLEAFRIKKFLGRLI